MVNLLKGNAENVNSVMSLCEPDGQSAKFATVSTQCLPMLCDDADITAIEHPNNIFVTTAAGTFEPIKVKKMQSAG